MTDRAISSPQIKAALLATLNNTVNDDTAGSASGSVAQGASIDITNLENGTNAYQFDWVWTANRTIADAATDQLDMYDLGTWDIGAGAGLDALGQSIANVEVVAYLILNYGPGKLEIDDTITNGWGVIGDLSAADAIQANGFIMRYEPQDGVMPVTDATGHLVDFTARSGHGALDMQISLATRTA